MGRAKEFAERKKRRFKEFVKEKRAKQKMFLKGKKGSWKKGGKINKPWKKQLSEKEQLQRELRRACAGRDNCKRELWEYNHGRKIRARIAEIEKEEEEAKNGKGDADGEELDEGGSEDEEVADEEKAVDEEEKTEDEEAEVEADTKMTSY